jgi:hypothetical protein
VRTLRDQLEKRDDLVVAGIAKLDVLDPPAVPAFRPPLQPREEAVGAAVDPGVRNVEVEDLDLGIERRQSGRPVLLHRRHEPSAHQLDVLVRHCGLSIPHPAYPRWEWPQRHQTA